MFVRSFSKRLAQDLEYMADEVVPWCGFAEIPGFARLRLRTRGYAGYRWTEGELHLLLRMKASPYLCFMLLGCPRLKHLLLHHLSSNLKVSAALPSRFETDWVAVCLLS